MSSRHTTNIEPLTGVFKALADPNRLRIVALLAQGELCVCHIESTLVLPQPTISRSLAILRHAGIVVSRRDGHWMHYRLAAQTDPAAQRVLNTLIAEFAPIENAVQHPSCC